MIALLHPVFRDPCSFHIAQSPFRCQFWSSWFNITARMAPNIAVFQVGRLRKRYTGRRQGEYPSTLQGRLLETECFHIFPLISHGQNKKSHGHPLVTRESEKYFLYSGTPGVNKKSSILLVWKKGQMDIMGQLADTTPVNTS